MKRSNNKLIKKISSKIFVLFTCAIAAAGVFGVSTSFVGVSIDLAVLFAVVVGVVLLYFCIRFNFKFANEGQVGATEQISQKLPIRVAASIVDSAKLAFLPLYRLVDGNSAGIAKERIELKTLIREMNDYAEETEKTDADMELIIELNAKSDEEQEATARELRATINRLQARLGCAIVGPKIDKRSRDKEFSLAHRQHLREAIKELIARRSQYILAPVPPVKELTSKKIAEIRENIKEIQLARREIHQQIVTLEYELLERRNVEFRECRVILKAC